jgi:hypothetical protein
VVSRTVDVIGPSFTSIGAWITLLLRPALHAFVVWRTALLAGRAVHRPARVTAGFPPGSRPAAHAAHW